MYSVGDFNMNSVEKLDTPAYLLTEIVVPVSEGSMQDEDSPNLIEVDEFLNVSEQIEVETADDDAVDHVRVGSASKLVDCTIDEINEARRRVTQILGNYSDVCAESASSLVDGKSVGKIHLADKTVAPNRGKVSIAKPICSVKRKITNNPSKQKAFKSDAAQSMLKSNLKSKTSKEAYFEEYQSGTSPPEEWDSDVLAVSRETHSFNSRVDSRINTLSAVSDKRLMIGSRANVQDSIKGDADGKNRDVFWEKCNIDMHEVNNLVDTHDDEKCIERIILNFNIQEDALMASDDYGGAGNVSGGEGNIALCSEAVFDEFTKKGKESGTEVNGSGKILRESPKNEKNVENVIRRSGRKVKSNKMYSSDDYCLGTEKVIRDDDRDTKEKLTRSIKGEDVFSAVDDRKADKIKWKERLKRKRKSVQKVTAKKYTCQRGSSSENRELELAMTDVKVEHGSQKEGTKTMRQRLFEENNEKMTKREMKKECMKSKRKDINFPVKNEKERKQYNKKQQQQQKKDRTSKEKPKNTVDKSNNIRPQFVYRKKLYTTMAFDDYKKIYPEAELCRQCGKICRSVNILRNHQLTHSDYRPFACSFCGRAFRQRIAQQEHERIHTGEKPFKCEICGKAFTSNGTKIKHCRIHFDERPYPCHICNMQFKQRITQQEHIATHSDRANYNCSICSDSFSTPSTLRLHKKKCHDSKETNISVLRFHFPKSRCQRKPKVSKKHDSNSRNKKGTI